MRPKQRQIINELGIKPEINPPVEIARRSRFLADYLTHSNLSGFVLGFSGGQDSLLAGILAQKAVELRRASGNQAEFHTALLPYGEQRDRADAELAINIIQPDHIHDIDIKPGVDALVRTINQAEQTPVSDFDKGNIKARMRMISQYALASAHGLLVIGTDHAAEAITGYFTKHGDGAADIMPLAGLTKRQGRAMLQALGVPEIFITKPPTADLLDDSPAQADEHELGISYEMIDDYLEGKSVPDEVATKLENRYDHSWHKRNLPAAYFDRNSKKG